MPELWVHTLAANPSCSGTLFNDQAAQSLTADTATYSKAAQLMILTHRTSKSVQAELAHGLVCTNVRVGNWIRTGGQGEWVGV